MPSIRPVKLLGAAAVLLAGGLLRLPLESRYTADLRERHIAEEPLNLGLREELGQSFFIAVLGGFRSLVASLTEVQSVDAWQQLDYVKVDAQYALCTKLQPREFHYWDFRAWMSSHNAYHYYRWQDESRPGASREWAGQSHVDHAITVLKEGLRHLPDEYRLYQSLAVLAADAHKNRHADHHEAAEYYLQAYQKAPGRRFLYRNYVYQMAASPGYEKEAWKLMLDLYNSPIEFDRSPTVLTMLAVLYPKVAAVDPAVILPPEVAAHAEELRRKRAAYELKLRNEGPPRVQSGNLKQKVN